MRHRRPRGCTVRVLALLYLLLDGASYTARVRRFLQKLFDQRIPIGHFMPEQPAAAAGFALQPTVPVPRARLETA